MTDYFPKSFPIYSLKSLSYIIQVINKPLPIQIYSSVDYFLSFIDGIKEDFKAMEKDLQSDKYKFEEIKYKVKNFIYTPTEIASRYAAKELIQILEK